MGWSRRRLLGALAAGAMLPGRAAASSGVSTGNLVLVVASGGWDVSFALDPKLGLDSVDGPELSGPGEELRTWGELTLATHSERRPEIAAFFDRWADRSAVINGVSTSTLSHERSLSRVLSGTWDARWPDLATLVGAAGEGTPLGTIDLSGLARFGPHAARCARWGRQGQARALLDPSAHYAQPETPDGGPWLAATTSERHAVDTWLDRRAEDLRRRWPEADEVVAAWRYSRERAIELRDRRPPIGRGLPWGWAASHASDVGLVTRIISEGLAKSVVVSTRQLWDTHATFETQHTSWNRTFNALNRLLSGLEDAGRLGDTTVLVVSEMSRTPVLNGAGGKDHWPWTSFLVAGAGVRGRVRLGATDERLRGLPVDIHSGRPDPSGGDLEPAPILAGVAEAVGVDPSWAFPNTPVCRGFVAG